jgi:cytochrome c peroxidase
MWRYVLVVGYLSLAISLRVSADERRHPLGLPTPVNETGTNLADIGKQLFFDTRLSADSKVSCASCHQPANVFTDGKKRATGFKGKAGTRNAPSLFNVRYQASLFWDGRETKLEAQARRPLTNPVEHGLANGRAVLN